MNPPEQSAAAELFALQVAQLRHDETYHREIARLTVHARLNHMALHFCKYVGQVASSLQSGDLAGARRAAVDTFIIALSSANTMSINISPLIPYAATAASVADCGRRLQAHTPKDHASLLISYALGAARISRACEKLDHVESYPFRDEIASSLGDLCASSIESAALFDFDLTNSVRKRLSEVEERYLFHDRI